MTVLTPMCESKLNKPLESKFKLKSERVATDKDGFGLLFCFMVVYIIYFIGILLDRNSVELSEKEKETSWNASEYTNETIPNIISLVNSTLRAMNDDNLLKNSYIAVIKGSLNVIFWVVAIYFAYIRCILVKIGDWTCKSFNHEYAHHFTIISLSRAIPILLIPIIINYLWIDTSEKLHFSSLICRIFESFIFIFLNVMICIKLDEKQSTSFKSILRFYFLRRNLMIFQFLNVLAMLLLMTGVAATMKFLFDTSQIVYQLVLIGTFFFVIVSMHTYAKMVIMLTTASYNWDEDKGGISCKLIISSMVTISRYHLGSIVKYCPMGEVGFCNRTWKPNAEIKTIESVYTTCDATFFMECSEILIAVHGQSIAETRKTINISKIKNWIYNNSNFKCITSIVWTDIMTMLTPIIFLLTSMEALSNIEGLFQFVMISTYYILICGIYYYVIIRPINIIELTIAFCKIVTKEDLEVMDDDEFSMNEFENVETQD